MSDLQSTFHLNTHHLPTTATSVDSAAMAISTEIYHLQELPRYASEKPYTMRYTPEGQIPVSNVLREKHVLEVSNMREDPDRYQVESNGFTVCTLGTKLEYEIFDSHEKITTVYFRELENILLKQFPGSTAEFVSYLVKRASHFLLSFH